MCSLLLFPTPDTGNFSLCYHTIFLLSKSSLPIPQFVRIAYLCLKVSSALLGLAFVIASARLSCLLIYLISYNLQRLYNQQIAMISIVRRFSLVVPSLTRHLQSKYKSIQTIIRMVSSLSQSVIILRVVLIAKAISAPLTIPYISDARTLLVTCLLFVELQ